MYSRNSSDSVIDVRHAHLGELVIDRHPLIIVVMHVVAVTMENGLQHVDEEENRDAGEYQSNPIARETDVKETISFKRGKGSPEEFVSRLARERGSLFLETLDVHIDSTSHGRLQFFTLEHLNNLGLLLGNSRIARSDFLKVLVEVVFHLIL